MIIEIVPVYQRRKLRVPPPESYYAFRRNYLNGLGVANTFGRVNGLGVACPDPTKPNANGNCCIPPSLFDQQGNRCAAPGAALIPNGNKYHWGTGGQQPPPCTPNCVNKTCGTDGCGGTCGSCGTGTECQGGSCVPDTGGGGGSTTTPGGGGGGGVVNVGTDGGSGLDLTGLLESPLVWIGGGLLLVAVAYRIIRKPTATPSTVVVK